MATGFELPQARLLPTLTGLNLDKTTAEFAAELDHQLTASDWTIGLFGMGADGHTAGILPASPAAVAPAYAASYQTPQFDRITMTPRAIARLDEAFVYAVGADKWPALERLAQPLTIDEQPIQSLKQVPLLTVFTDFEGDKS